MQQPELLVVVLLLWILPIAFVIWAIVSAVSALQRIARALENVVPEKLSASMEETATEKGDPAYKYIPKPKK